MVVADPLLVARRRTGRLDPPHQARLGEGRRASYTAWARDGTDLAPDGLGDGVGGHVRFVRDRPQNGQPLGGDSEAALPKEAARVETHVPTLSA